MSISLTPEMLERAEEARKGDYSSRSEYIRSMVTAGESRVAALDPRTQEGRRGEMSNTDSVEEAAQALTDAVLLAELSEDPQTVADVLEAPTNKFQTVLATKLSEMAADESSPVEQDPLTSEYTLER